MKNLIIGVIVVMVVAAGALFVLVGNINSVVQGGIETAGPTMLKAPVEVAEVNISVLNGTGEIKGLKVGNPEGYKEPYAFAIDRILIELDPLSVISDRIHFKKIVIDKPAILYEGNFSDSNIQQLQRNVEAVVPASEVTDGQSETETAESQSIQIDYLSLNDTNIDVSLSFLGDEKLNLIMPSLTMTDIGKDEDLSVAQAIQEILRILNQSLVPLIQENAGDLGSQFKEQGEKLKESVDKGIEKLKSLFN